MTETVEFAVVGAGLLGLAAARSLAQRSADVVVLEAYGASHDGGGSHGGSRIFRLGYDDPGYVRMAMRARDGWRRLEAEAGEELLRETGQLTFGGDLGALEVALRAAGAPCEPLDAAEVAARWPVLRPPGPALYEPRSGVLAADRCISALRRQLGGRLREGCRVLSLVESAGGVTILTADGEIRASVAVCCAGAATAGLVPRLAVPLRATREQVAFFAMPDGACPEAPVVIEQSDPYVYGLPVQSLGLYKLAHHHAGREIDAAEVGPPSQEPDPQLVEAIVPAAVGLIPGIDPLPRRTERCVYDTTADTHFVLDRLGRIVVGAGTSGHGFKFGPLLGETLARLALGDTDGGVVPLGRFSASRG